MDIKGLKINFMGDSITEGLGSKKKKKKGYVSVIAEKYGAVCNNYGYSGTRIAKQTVPSAEKRSDNFFCGRIDEMDKDADAVVIFGGTNDFGHGDAELGCMSDRTYDTFYGALHYLYSNIIEKFPTAKIVVVTPTHRINEDNLRGDGFKPHDYFDLKTYVNIIREVAEYYSLPVLDLFKESGLQPKVPVIQKMYMPDGLHPSDLGHSLLAEKIANFLIKL